MENLRIFFEVIQTKLTEYYVGLVAFLPDFILAVIVLLIFVYVSRHAEKLVRRLMMRISTNISLVELTSIIASRLVIVVGVFYALGILGLYTTVSSLLAGAGIVGLAIGFAFQDLTANFLSGIFITIGQPIRVGDVIETNGFLGKVKEIKIRSTVLDNFAGQEIEIPSRRIFENAITNYGKTGGRRIQITCGVSYNEDLDEVQRVAIQAVESLGIHDKNKPIDLNFREFSDSSITFWLWFWLDLTDPANVGAVVATSQAIKAIKKAFDAHDITIPFPIRALDFQQQGATPVQVIQHKSNGHPA
jgi:small conductance mechanosensitive channel